MRFNPLTRFPRPCLAHLLLTLICAVPPLTGCRPPADQTNASPATENLTPVQVARAFNAACRQGDRATALRLARIDTRTERELAQSMIDAGAATERLRNAVGDRFGPDAVYETDFGLPYDEEFDDAVERIHGEEALVLMAAWKDVPDPQPDGVGVTRLTRRTGQWLVELHPRDATEEEIRATTTLNRYLVGAADRTLRLLKAGRFAEPSEVGGAMRSELH